MAIQRINVTNRVATHLKKGGTVVCGNTDYVVEFLFDSEWYDYEEKTARFVWNNKFQDVKFTGNTCPMPAVHRTDFVSVGVYAGDLCTTTPAVIPCQRSILCGSDTPHDGNEANYASEAQQAAKAAQEAADEAKRAAGEAAGKAVASFAEQSAAQLLGGIVQDAGDCETVVMSQKAATKIFANALKGAKVGETVIIKDISPLEHDLVVAVGSKNLIPPNYVGFRGTDAEGKEFFTASGEINGVQFTVNDDGSITINGEATAAITYTLIKQNAPITVAAGAYIISASADFPSGCNLWLRVTNAGSSAKQNQILTLTEAKNLYSYITITAGTKIENFTIYPMAERGTTATAYTPYVADIEAVKVYAQGRDGASVEYAVNADGTVDGVKSMSPIITLTTDTSGVVIDCQYNKDINQALEDINQNFEKITQAIISLGGNI